MAPGPSVPGLSVQEVRQARMGPGNADASSGPWRMFNGRAGSGAHFRRGLRPARAYAEVC